MFKENWAHIPGSAPPIGDFTPSGRSDIHPDHQGHTYTTTTLASQTQTWTHVPEEQMTNVHHRQTPPYQVERRDEPVMETGEVIYITITDHSKTTRSIAHRHTIICALRIQQNMLNTLPPNAPQPERTTRSTIEAHTSSSRAHILTLLDRIDTTLLYHQIPNGITPHTYLFPLWR